MTYRDADVIGSLAYVGSDGRPAHVPNGPCRLHIGPRSVTVRWGDQPGQSTSFPIHLLDEFVSGGAIECHG